MRMRRFLLVLAPAALVLLGAVVLQGLNLRNVQDGDSSTPARPVQLDTAVPAALPGWTSKDEPLGPNEMVRSAVERTLNFDDHVYRVFARGDVRVGVYVAYWGPGRMPLQKVASHTPDRCWSENGWSCADMRFAEVVAVPGVTLRPAQWRIFIPPGAPEAREHVLYWHLVGDQLYDYGERFNKRPDIVKWWRDTVDYALSGSDAQYFVRLTSNRPFAEFADDPGWQELIAALGRIGLAGNAAAAAR